MLAWRPLWAVGFLGAMQPLTAEAGEPAPRVRFEFHAPAACPGAHEFLANVREKAVFELVDSAERASRTFVVTLSERADGAAPAFLGELRVVTPRGTASTRAVSGVNCAEVAEAVAVIIAIDLAPENREEPGPVPADRPARPVSVTKARWRWAAAADFGFTSAVASAISPQARLALVLRRESSELFSPEFRAGFAYVDGRTTVNQGGSLELGLYGLALEACPVAFRFSRRLAVEPCASALLALRHASGGPPSNPEAEQSNGWWVDVGMLARASLALSEAWWLEISTEGFAVLVRDRFYTFSPGITLFEPPAAGVRVAIGLGLHFW